jgi:hypothetical protein
MCFDWRISALAYQLFATDRLTDDFAIFFRKDYKGPGAVTAPPPVSAPVLVVVSQQSEKTFL